MVKFLKGPPNGEGGGEKTGGAPRKRGGTTPEKKQKQKKKRPEKGGGTTPGPGPRATCKRVPRPHRWLAGVLGWNDGDGQNRRGTRLDRRRTGRKGDRTAGGQNRRGTGQKEDRIEKGQDRRGAGQKRDMTGEGQDNGSVLNVLVIFLRFVRGSTSGGPRQACMYV